MKYQNPIIRGFHPDPSICRVGEDYYLVTSTFEFFPGVPIFHSKNLVDWKLIGHCLTRKSQLLLDGCGNSQGIYAPTLRYYGGTFYMITTNKSSGGNFIVMTQDIKGDWSEPIWIDQNGIDPSLFWDDDGTCYFVGKGTIAEERGIVGFELNPKTGEILSKRQIISKGCGGQCAEGPHIFKKEGYYYLLIAEGGTAYGHRETIQRAKNIWGPYEACPYNSILTHKESKASLIQAVGHADFIEDHNKNWWTVCLGIRVFADVLLHNLGRETFLAPVVWRDGWPIVGEEGKLDFVMEGPLPAMNSGMTSLEENCTDTTILFSEELWDKRFFYTRNPNFQNYHLDHKHSRLILQGSEVTLDTPCASPTMLSVVQPEFCTCVTAEIDLDHTNAERCGIAVYFTNYYHYDLYISTKAHSAYIGFYKHIHDFGAEQYAKLIEKQGKLCLKIKSDREKYTFYYKTDSMREYQEIGTGVNAGMCTEASMERCYTGTMYSLFCEQGMGVFCNQFSIRTI